MSEEQKKTLEKQLWGVANVLRGKMNADEYKNYILGFIFYKYLSEKLEHYVNEKLIANEDFKFTEIKENTKKGKQYLEHIKNGCVGYLGFFLKPTELFNYLVKKGKGETKDSDTFILEDLKNVLNTIEQTSMGTASEDDFKGLFDDVDLTSTKLGSRENQKNDVVTEVLGILNGIDFRLKDKKSDLLGDAYEYLIGEFAAGAGKDNSKKEVVYPWEEPHIRNDVIKNLPLRFSEPLYLKLKYIADHTPYSMNSFILERLTKEIEQEIIRLTD